MSGGGSAAEAAPVRSAIGSFSASEPILLKGVGHGIAAWLAGSEIGDESTCRSRTLVILTAWPTDGSVPGCRHPWDAASCYP